MLLCEARKGIKKKTHGEKEGKKLVVGALIAPIGWLPLALAKKGF